jgi:hypothetical protein
VIPIGSLQTLIFCTFDKSEERNLVTVPLVKLTTKRAEPSPLIAKLLAVAPVLTLFIA